MKRMRGQMVVTILQQGLFRMVTNGMVEGEVDGVFLVPSGFDGGADVGVHLPDEVGKGIDGGEGVVDGGIVRA